MCSLGASCLCALTVVPQTLTAIINSSPPTRCLPRSLNAIRREIKEVAMKKAAKQSDAMQVSSAEVSTVTCCDTTRQELCTLAPLSA